MRYSKPGYGDVVWMSAEIIGGGNKPLYQYNGQGSAPKIMKISSTVTTLHRLGFEDTTYFIAGKTTYFAVQGDFTADPLTPRSEQAMVLYFSHSPNVSGTPGDYATAFVAEGVDYNSSPVAPYNCPFDTTAGTFLYLITESQLNSYGFNSGDSVYVATYGTPYCVSGEDYANYYDPGLEQYVFTSINQTPSPVIGTKMP